MLAVVFRCIIYDLEWWLLQMLFIWRLKNLDDSSAWTQCAQKSFTGSLLSGMKRCTGLKCWSGTREGPRLQTLWHTQHISSCDGPQFISVWFIGTRGSAEKCLSKSWLDYKHWLQLNEIRGNKKKRYLCFVFKTFFYKVVTLVVSQFEWQLQYLHCKLGTLLWPFLNHLAALTLYLFRFCSICNLLTEKYLHRLFWFYTYLHIVGTVI